MYLVMFVCGACAVIGLLWALLRASIEGSYRQQPIPGSVPRARWAAFFVATCATAILLEIPLRVGFAISKPAMTRFLHDRRQNPKLNRGATQQVGLYMLSAIVDESRVGMWRICVNNNIQDGFAFSEVPVRYAGRNPGAGGSLGGGWYWFSDD